jgi:hypothetical protein
VLIKRDTVNKTPDFQIDIELIVFTDREWDDVINLGMIDSLDLPDPKYSVWRCPKCERIYVFDGNAVVRRYMIEEE